MARIFKYASLAMILLAVTALSASTPEPLNPRAPSISFEGRLLDAKGLSAAGTVEAEARFYRTAERKPADLLYAEQFSGVSVERGHFRLPLLTGAAVSGTSFSADAFENADLLYVDILINSAPMLEAWPLRPALSAMRAEKTASADALRMPLMLKPEDIPQHDATLITSGYIPEGRITSVLAGQVGGVFPQGMIPGLNANKITSGSFPDAAVPPVLNASWFESGILSDALVPSDAMRAGSVGVRMGTAFDGTDVKMPDGFQRSQCTWMTSFREIESKADGIDHIHMSTDSNGVVKCQVDFDTSVNPTKYPCYVNYLTLCRK